MTAWRQANPEQAKIHNRNATVALRDRHREIVLETKTGPCTDCGRADLPPEAMDLDHVPGRGPKLFNLSTVRKRPLGQVIVELAKCDRVCPACHRLRTLARGQYRKAS